MSADRGRRWHFETRFFDLENGFVVLHAFCQDSTRARAAFEIMRERLQSILGNASLDAGINRFKAKLSNGDHSRLAYLEFIVFLEDAPQKCASLEPLRSGESLRDL